MKALKWPGIQDFSKMKWTALDNPEEPGVTGAFVKTYKNFTFYWILKAGHMVRMLLKLCKSIYHILYTLSKCLIKMLSISEIRFL